VNWKTAAAQKTVDTIRVLSAEAVERAQSGHPGMPMGAADFALVLWAGHLRFDPADPNWPNRDRFILSSGHGSMLLYSLLHLFGFPLTLEDIKSFRQWGSRTPGHPEHGITPGVETTTGPLGQGFANGVGMALAQKLIAARVNTDKFPILDHRVYAIVSDGDIMEGVTAEAASLAGHLGLGNLIYLYDDNDITIEGDRNLAFSDDTRRRFEALHWQVLPADGHDRDAVDAALRAARAETGRPSLIMCKTRIGFGCPHKCGAADVHGAPLGADELKATRAGLCWNYPEFFIPAEAYDFCREAARDKIAAAAAWRQTMADFRRQEPERAKLFNALVNGELPADLEERALAAVDQKPVATRKASGQILQALSPAIPALFGGSADLHPSTNTLIKKQPLIGPGRFEGRNLHFGIREHAMAGMANGMALSGLIPYVGTFMVFSDYMRPSVRLAALMKLRVIYVFTHDSIFVGEDGPTHQPVEHVAALRLIPNLHLFRPADGPETAIAWTAALRRLHGPTALALTRQTVPALDRARYAPADGARRGGYVLGGADEPGIILMASGSELPIAAAAFEELEKRGVKARLISMPCLELFDEQDEAYRRSVLPPACRRRVAIEAGRSTSWHKYTGLDGLILGLDRFGASAPASVLAREFGFYPEAALAAIGRAYPEFAP